MVPRRAVLQLLLCATLLLASTPGQLYAQAQGNSDAQTAAIGAQIQALLGKQDEPVLADQWRNLGPLAAPILNGIATDPTALPTRRARSLEGLAALGTVGAAALFSQLATSDQEPLIVRMAAARGLGAVVPEPQRVADVSPLLAASDPQVRGTAAEVLSQDAAGCAAVAADAIRETDAWRSRFVQACPGLANAQTQTISSPIDFDSSTDISTIHLGHFMVPSTQLSSPIVVDVPQSAVSLDLVGVATDSDVRVVVYQVVDPSGTTVWNYAGQNPTMKLQPAIQPGNFSVLLPNSPTVHFTPGRWTFYLVGARPTTANVEALIKTSSANVLSSGTLDMDLFFVGVPGLTAASAQTDPNFQTLLLDVARLYQQVGLRLGRVTYIDITGTDATRFANVQDGDLGQLFQLSNRTGARNRAANVFLVHSIEGASLPGFVILGESGGIPGTPLRGTSASGVAITMADYPLGLETLAETIAHENGHWLGLFHTTEALGTSFDPLPDTPECPRVPFDTNNDGIMEPIECITRDATNLMFWTGDPSIPNTMLTPNQQFVMLRDPVVGPRD